MSYYEYNGLKVTKGNLKIGNDTLIFNMGSATDCPSLKLGYCKLGKKCYAYKAERLYPNVKPYRDKQASYWKFVTSRSFIADFTEIMRKHKRALKDIKYLRLNEAGDFYSQHCVAKLSAISLWLKRLFNITVYTYTARKDLDFSTAHFLVKGSSNDVGNNGKSIARPKLELEKQGTFEHGMYYENEQHFALCEGNCRTCSLCKKKNNTNIVFPIH